jgi:hypothetical protein
MLVEGLSTKYGARGERKLGQPGWHASQNKITLRECHYLRKIQPTKKKKANRGDVLCVPRMVERRLYCCRGCNVGLCLEDCFEAHHKKINY